MEPAPALSDSADVSPPSEAEKAPAPGPEEPASVTVHRGEAAPPLKDDSIRPFDFRHPVFLSAGEMRRLRQRHEEFLVALAARLSLYLRLEFTLQMTKMETVRYQQFANGLSDPSHITLFKVEPLVGVCLLDLRPRFGLTLVDRLMGGPARPVEGEPELREIERALLDQVVHIILSEWCGQWAQVQEMRPLLLGHEANPKFLQSSPHDTVMLVMTVAATLGEYADQLQLAFPYYTIEPLMRKWSEAKERQMKSKEPAKAVASVWNRRFDEVPVALTAEWPELEMTARDLGNLKPGDVLELDAHCVNQVMIRLANQGKYRGRLGKRAGKWAVELTSVIPPSV